MSKIPKNQGKLMKIANIDKEFLHIFWTTWGNSIKFSGKMCFNIILNVTKHQSFTLSLKDTFFEQLQEGGWKLTPPPPPPAILGLIAWRYPFKNSTHTLGRAFEIFFHLSHCRRKVFNEAYDKINELSVSSKILLLN